MTSRKAIASVRLLPDDVANKIAAGEVVERPASVVKELVENALDAGATRITVRAVGAGRRLIEVIDNGHGMSEQDAMLSIERHATSKIRKAEDLDNITTLGFRGEALASIAAVSRFEMVTRREKDASATRIQVDGGILREVSQAGAAVGTRVSVNRLYFNTPVRAKFLKGITTELSHCIDVVQRHALANAGVGFQFEHNDKLLLDIPEHATLRERIALIWGLTFVNDMVEVEGEGAGLKMTGLIGTPGLSRSGRSHQFFFMNGRPVVNRALQFGFEDGYHGLLTIGRHPVGVMMLSCHPRFVDVNIHPTKREIRFRDERVVRDAIRDVVRGRMAQLSMREPYAERRAVGEIPGRVSGGAGSDLAKSESVPMALPTHRPSMDRQEFLRVIESEPDSARISEPEIQEPLIAEDRGTPDERVGFSIGGRIGAVEPEAVYRSIDSFEADPIQVFDTYLIVPEEDRLLIIDQHALHERLNYDRLVAELGDNDYESQQLAVPILIDVPPAQSRLLSSNVEMFSRMGIEIEPFGGDTYQITSICPLYDEARVADAIYKILDELGQGNLFDREDFMPDFLRVATQACRASVRAGDRLSLEEKRRLVEGFRRLRPPYTCPHGRPIITELTVTQMEKSFRRRQ